MGAPARDAWAGSGNSNYLQLNRKRDDRDNAHCIECKNPV